MLGWLTAEAGRRRLETMSGRATELESDAPLAVFRDAIPDLTPDWQGQADSRWELFRSVAGLLVSRRQLVIVLDDPTGPTRSHGELLEMLVRRPPESAHLLLVASRPGSVVDGVTVAARSAGRDATVLDLEPLSRVAAEEMLGSG